MQLPFTQTLGAGGEQCHHPLHSNVTCHSLSRLLSRSARGLMLASRRIATALEHHIHKRADHGKEQIWPIYGTASHLTLASDSHLTDLTTLTAALAGVRYGLSSSALWGIPSLISCRPAPETTRSLVLRNTSHPLIQQAFSFNYQLPPLPS